MPHQDVAKMIFLLAREIGLDKRKKKLFISLYINSDISGNDSIFEKYWDSKGCAKNRLLFSF